jgi:hypothetical protein
MECSLAALLLPCLWRFLRFLLVWLRATLVPVVGLAVASMPI